MPSGSSVAPLQLTILLDVWLCGETRPVGHSDLCNAVNGVRAKQKDKTDSLRPCLSRRLYSLNTTGSKHELHWL